MLNIVSIVACIAIFVGINAFKPGTNIRIRPASSLSMISGRALVIQNKGGGHGTIGYELCKSLKKQHSGLDIVILQDKCNYKKPPFSFYEDLKRDFGVTIVDAPLSGSDAINADSIPAAISGVKFDYIIDNWSKKPENAQLGINIAKESAAKQYLFVSSAGMYKGSGLTPCVETDPVKTNDARSVELAVIESGLPYTFVRPQYIYGPKSNKRYLDFFIGRAYRKLPTPIPLHGEQLVCLTHIEDVANLIAAAVGHPAALGEIFNCGTDRYITYKGLSKIIHEKYGNSEDDIKFLSYEPKLFDHWDGSGVMEFPFRRDTFITTPSKAKLALGWSPKHNIVDDIAEEIAEYEAQGGTKESWGLEQLRYDMEVSSGSLSSLVYHV
jgi:nucleoside-diphosphate-sugar epimerase